MSDYVLDVSHVAKRFPPNVVALVDASLQVRPGEVHCLLGANGAGKSTLLKIVAGVHRPDTGAMEIDGRRVDLRSPHEASANGIAMIYQELDLIAQMTVEENLLLGHTPRRFGIVARKQRRALAAAALARVGAMFPLTARVETLSIANQQLAAIARALTASARIVVMDEPSAALNETELEKVFQVIREITADGVAVLYVSHRLNEIREIGDRVTVLRSGRTVDTFDVAAVDEAALVSAVVGDSHALLERGEFAPPEEALALRVKRLDGPAGLSIRDLEVRRGEVVGLAGLNGAGRTTLLKALFGVTRASGDVELFGAPYRPRHAKDAIRRGVGLVPENRKTEGLVLDAPIYRNATLARIRRQRWLSHRRMKAQAQPVLKQLQTRFGSVAQPVRQLSGGNQQKVVVAKWILDGAQLLLLDEPSRGLDIGAKADLYRLARGLAQEGAAILVASSELEELYANCNRIWVIHEGRNTVCFDPAVATSREIQQATITGRRT
ncbi:sugar ABC transporter ATP-binding protein [Paraburkholderia sp. J41]|uniref:sugar ABC transporter ATP-binding protein n=1 Tax=Paraburkholderia sp. J41 TaxID=2805433 RepID=UPI002AC35CB0|nr:sugar ABC transporter ATP-binding protein [Paraburkholderia sp. J41]